jgi:hypothetical protein
MAIFTAIAVAAVVTSGINAFGNSISHTIVYLLVGVSAGGLLLYFFGSNVFKWN